MRIAYLGLFSSVFNWVFNKILAPVIKFIANILSVVFEFIFNNVLMPILTLVFKTVLPWFIKLLVQIFSEILYTALALICKILDYISEMFDIFSGAAKVTYKGEQMTLLDAILSMKSVQGFFGAVLITAMFLAVIFAIIAVTKSTLDFDFENKRPVGAVMRALLKTMINFLLVQIMVYFILAVSGIVLTAITEGSAAIMSSGTESTAADGTQTRAETTLGRVVLCVASLDASNVASDNISSGGTDLFTKGNRLKLYDKNGIDYTDNDLVDDYFSFEKFDFLTGTVVVVFLVVIMAIAAIVFVQRLFEIAVLYVVSPLFICTMPLDDGEKFKKWKDLFLGKVFGGYGSVLAMKLYLLLIRFIIGNTIKWGASSDEATYIIKVIFLMGGAYALVKVGPMVTTLINWQAGQAESATNSMVGRYAEAGIKKGVMKTAAFTGKMLGKGARAVGGKVGGALGIGGDSKKVADEKWNKLQKNQQADFKDKPVNPIEDQEKSKDPNRELKDEIAKEFGLTPGGGKEGGKGGAGNKATPGDRKLKDNEKGLKTPNRNAASKADLRKDGQNTLAFAGGTGTATSGKNADGSAKQKGRFDRFMNAAHRILPHKQNKDGSYSFGFLGFRVNYDKDGNRTGFKIPCASFQYDKDGKSHLTKLNVGGLFKMQRSGQTGKMHLSDIPAIGLRRVEGSNGDFFTSRVGFGLVNRAEGKDGQIHTSSVMGGLYQAQEDPTGKFHMSSLGGMKFGMEYNKETDQYEVSGCRIGNFIFGGGENANYDMNTEKEHKWKDEDPAPTGGLGGNIGLGNNNNGLGDIPPANNPAPPANNPVPPVNNPVPPVNNPVPPVNNNNNNNQ